MTKKTLELAKNLLCPPGNGVFTVNTAADKKAELHKKLYGSSEDIVSSWENSIEKTLDSNAPLLLGVCSDTGGGIQRGANWGPLYLRRTLLEEHPQIRYQDLGDVRVIPHLLHDKYLNEKTIKSCRNALYGDDKSTLPVSALSITETICDELYDSSKDRRIFAIGGDHSVSYPLVKSYLKNKKKQGINAAIIHFDAHTDLLIERLGIDICFGSWCPHIMPFLKRPDHLIQLGIRSSGKEKSHWESTFGVQQYWAQEINDLGANKVAQEIIKYLEDDGVEELYISFDIDALDDLYASATGTPEPNGMTPDQAITIIKMLSAEFKITGADMVEIAPLVQSEAVKHPEPHTTLTMGAAIAACIIEALDNADS